jgi:hypothetical protein
MMYSLHRPIPKEEPQHLSWIQILEYALVVGIIITAFVIYGHTIIEFIVQTCVDMFYLIFDLPIRELYRHGPYFIGWEGMDLPDICSRITYHGDRQFWGRNQEECLAIFNLKEEAFVRICRPIMYVVLALIIFYVIRHLVAVYAENKRDRTDRVVLETYHAFQTMIRLITRQVERQTGRKAS